MDKDDDRSQAADDRGRVDDEQPRDGTAVDAADDVSPTTEAPRRTRRTYEAVAETYHERTREIDALVPDVARLCDRLPDAPRVLDAGCGPGRDAAVFHEHGARVVGLDFAGSQLRLASGTAPGARLVQGDLRTLPLATDSVDGVWAAASLIHVSRERLGDALAELRRVTRPGGALFASMKPGHREELTHGYGTDTGRYFVFHDPDAFAERVARAEFDVDAIETDDGWFRLFASA